MGIHRNNQEWPSLMRYFKNEGGLKVKMRDKMKDNRKREDDRTQRQCL